MRRRDLLTSMALTAAAGAAQPASGQQAPPAAKRTGKLKQAVTNMCFGTGADFENTCKIAAEIGFKGYDLVNPADWPTLKKYGLTPVMSPGSIPRFLSAADAAKQAAERAAAAARGGGPGGAPGAGRGPGGAPGGGRGGAPSSPAAMSICYPEHHDEQVKLLTASIDQAAEWGAPNVIVFSGTRREGMSDAQAGDNAAALLNRVKAHAEEKGVNLCIEYLNSRVDHRGTIFDHMDWGVDVMLRVNSPRVGILYDMYHVQIDDGDVVRRMRDNLKWVKHIHTAGNPGRNQLDDNQELNWRFIARAIAESGYDGWVGHEYRPTAGADPVACLKQAFEIFNV